MTVIAFGSSSKSITQLAEIRFDYCIFGPLASVCAARCFLKCQRRG